MTDGWHAERVSEEVASLPDAEQKLLSKRWRAFRFLTGEIAGLPRHASQHPGGMVISSRPLVELVPVQPAAMAGRQLCQWDKDSCADAGFLKIDLLGLGMLSCVEECVDRIAQLHGAPIDLSRIPLDDPDVFAEIQAADTVGVFQIESRAQMQSLLRTRPETIDDLTIQVALVRPGPIQGKAVHPYIEHRRRLREDSAFVYPVPHESLREPLASTLGVVVFQDQVLDVAIALAGFTIGEAEGLRRAMSRKRSHVALEAHRVRFVEGAVASGVAEEVAQSVFDTLVGFSGFGFPKAHAAAFGLLAYQSAWLRHHYPAEFLCGLLNEQPMGFYPPASLVRDAQRRGVEVLPPDVNLSEARCSLEACVDSTQALSHAVRVGLAYVSSVGKDDAEALEAERVANGPYRDVGDLARRAAVSRDALEALVRGGACDGFGPRRRDLLWELGLATRPRSVEGTRGEAKQLPLPLDPTAETPELPDLTRWERMLADYRETGLSVGTHPLALLRRHLPPGTLSSPELHEARHGTTVAFAGMATGTYERERELQAAITPLVESTLPDVEVLAVELLSPARFCVYVDTPAGVDFALCERVTRLLDAYRSDWTVDVSSPGPERPLRRAEHFRRAIGGTVKLKTASAKRVRGTLVGAGDDAVTVQVNGTTLEIPVGEIVRGNLIDEGRESWSRTASCDAARRCASSATARSSTRRRSPS